MGTHNFTAAQIIPKFAFFFFFNPKVKTRHLTLSFVQSCSWLHIAFPKFNHHSTYNLAFQLSLSFRFSETLYLFLILPYACYMPCTTILLSIKPILTTGQNDSATKSSISQYEFLCLAPTKHSSPRSLLTHFRANTRIACSHEINLTSNVASEVQRGECSSFRAPCFRLFSTHRNSGTYH
jgi:hypothetical protein